MARRQCQLALVAWCQVAFTATMALEPGLPVPTFDSEVVSLSENGREIARKELAAAGQEDASFGMLQDLQAMLNTACKAEGRFARACQAREQTKAQWQKFDARLRAAFQKERKRFEQAMERHEKEVHAAREAQAAAREAVRQARPAVAETVPYGTSGMQNRTVPWVRSIAGRWRPLSKSRQIRKCSGPCAACKLGWKDWCPDCCLRSISRSWRWHSPTDLYAEIFQGHPGRSPMRTTSPKMPWTSRRRRSH